MTMHKITNLKNDYAYFMSIALDCAQKALFNGEIPVGAVVVNNKNKILSMAQNTKESRVDPTAHAELIAIKKACHLIGDWRLNDLTLYVTKEPCIMCSGAILNSRVKRLVYGCHDPKGGGVNSLYNLLCDKRLNHRVEVINGVLEQECAEILRTFFMNLRNKEGSV